MLTISSPENFDWENIDLVSCCYGNAMDTYFTLKIFRLLDKEVNELELQPLTDNLFKDANPIFSDIEYNGMNISREGLAQLDEDLKDVIHNLVKDIKQEYNIDENFNLKSSKQISELLYEEEGGLELYPPSKTKSGKCSTDKNTLNILIHQIDEELKVRERKK